MNKKTEITSGAGCGGSFLVNELATGFNAGMREMIE